MVEAGKAYERAAQVQADKLGDRDDMANTLIDAFKVYRKDDPQAAVRCLEQSVAQYCSKGNFRRAASHKEAMGDLYDEMGDKRNASDSYESAAEWYEGDNATAYVFCNPVEKGPC